MIIKNGVINDAVHSEAYCADILIKDGKICAVGKDISAEGEEIFDASGLNVYPGLVEAHCHIGLHGFAIGAEGIDVNEKSDVVTPQLRAIDAFNPMDRRVSDGLKAGITTICTGPGSANAIGGTFVAVKTVGNVADEMVIKNPAAMKCALGENPKKVYAQKSNGTRMSTAAKIREALYTAMEYQKRIENADGDVSKLPKFDMKSEALLPVLKKEIPLKIHAHRSDDICTAIRIAREFDVLLTIEHCTEGHLIADYLGKCGYPAAVGPTNNSPSKAELANKSYETPGVLSKSGVQVSITTDAPVIPLTNLTLAASYAIKNGMDRFEALRAITINPANHIGVGNRVGSIEVGKDADIVVADGDIFDLYTKINSVFVNGNREV